MIAIILIGAFEASIKLFTSRTVAFHSICYCWRMCTEKNIIFHNCNMKYKVHNIIVSERCESPYSDKVNPIASSSRDTTIPE